MLHTVDLTMSIAKTDTRLLLLLGYFFKLQCSGTNIPGITVQVNAKTPHDGSKALIGCYFNLHIDALRLAEKGNLDTPHDYEVIADAVNSLLEPVNMSIQDMRVYRIDYCYNALIPDPNLRQLLLHLWSKCDLSGGRLRMNKYSDQHPKKNVGINNAYFHNHKRSLQIYDKETERADKGKPVLHHEENVIRLEYQTFYEEIKEAGNDRYEAWANNQRAFAQLSKGAEVFFSGDFYSIRAADLLLKKAGLSPLLCAKLHHYMVSVSRLGVARAAASYGENKNANSITKKTAKDYRRILCQHGICPVPIPKSYGISHMANPFNQILTGGVAA